MEYQLTRKAHNLQKGAHIPRRYQIMSINVNKPPQRMVFVLERENDYVQEGEWFLPPAKGTIYQWTWPDRSKERHPVYRLIAE